MAFTLLLFFVFGAIGAATASKEEQINVKENSILKIQLNKTVEDYVPTDDNPIAQLLQDDKAMDIDKILSAIENAKTDSKIKGISIEGGMLSIGSAQLKEIRDQLLDFKSSGKFITAYSDIYSQKNFYLSSVADSIYISPVGAITFEGLSSEVLFLKNLQEKTGIEMEVIRHGKYKSAVEPFLSNTMSESNREQISELLHSVWASMLSDIARDRNTTPEKLNEYADTNAINTPKKALANKMVTDILYKDQYETLIKNQINVEKTHEITLSDYISTGKGRISRSSSNNIAVIYAQGEIIYGEGNASTIGNESLIKAIRTAKEKESIKSVVLRINSPGGSALASDLIWRELELLKEEKPFVVSMGNVAASGGYYIAAGANHIYAESTTVTGSIGVFGVLPNMSKIAENIGVNAERVSTNKGAFYSPFEPMQDDFYQQTKAGVEEVYDTFLDRVASGREMTKEQVNDIAQGRVWTGKQALENNLIDTIGSLEDAIEKAASLASLNNFKVKKYPKFDFDFKSLMNPYSIEMKETMIEEEIGTPMYKIYTLTKTYQNMTGIQARIPFEMEIK